MKIDSDSIYLHELCQQLGHNISKGTIGHAIWISGNIHFVSVETIDAFYCIYINGWNSFQWDGITFSGTIHFENSLFNNSILNLQQMDFFEISYLNLGTGVIFRGHMLFDGIETKSFYSLIVIV